MLILNSYDYDQEEIDSLKQRIMVLQDEFTKSIGIMTDDSVKSIIGTIKRNYDEHAREIIDNAERSLKTINKIKSSFETPVIQILNKLKAPEYGYESELQKYKRELEDSKQLIFRLQNELDEYKVKDAQYKQERSKNEKRLLKELKIVNKENKQMKDVIQEFKDEVDY